MLLRRERPNRGRRLSVKQMVEVRKVSRKGAARGADLRVSRAADDSTNCGCVRDRR